MEPTFSPGCVEEGQWKLQVGWWPLPVDAALPGHFGDESLRGHGFPEYKDIAVSHFNFVVNCFGNLRGFHSARKLVLRL